MSEWKESLPEELREAPYFKAAESLEQAIDGIRDAAQWQGNSLRIPSPDASDEARQEFRNKAVEKLGDIMPIPTEDNLDVVFSKIGKPEEAGKYALPEIDEKVTLTEEDVAAMKTWAFENNLTQDQFAQYVSQNATRVLEAGLKAENQYAEENALLKQEWGQDYDRRMESIGAWIKAQQGPEDLANAVSEGRVTSSMAKWLYGVTEAMAEDGEVSGQERVSEPKMTPAEAAATLAELTDAVLALPPGDPRVPALNQKRIAAAQAVADAKAAREAARLADFKQVR